MILSADQIRAARALKNWSQADLAQKVGMATPSIGNIEAGKHNPTVQTQKSIKEAFEDEGIEFIDGGVRKRYDLIRVFEGHDCYLKLLDDVYYTLKNQANKELLISCADDKVSPPSVNESYRRLRKEGVAMRQLVEENNEYLMGPLTEYRYLPKAFFVNRVSLIYGDKVASVLDRETKVVIFKDEVMAYTQRNLFNLLWQTLPQPKKSVADERF